MEQFDALLAQTIDSTLGLRCTLFGYQYSEILRSLMCVYLCGGSCVEDISTHLMKHLSLHPTLRTCSADTILRAIEELTCKNNTYKSASGKSYDFNTADKMNCLLIKALLATGQLKSGQEYDFDFDHQFIETEKYDAKPTYKKFLGYSPDHRGCWLCERGYEDSSKTKVENEDQDFHRPSAVSIVISVIIVSLGIISLSRLPIEKYPDVAPPTISVWASYPGASAEAVQKCVLAPLEQAINGVDNMTYMTSPA